MIGKPIVMPFVNKLYIYGFWIFCERELYNSNTRSIPILSFVNTVSRDFFPPLELIFYL